MASYSVCETGSACSSPLYLLMAHGTAISRGRTIPWKKVSMPSHQHLSHPSPEPIAPPIKLDSEDATLKSLKAFWKEAIEDDFPPSLSSTSLFQGNSPAHDKPTKLSSFVFLKSAW